MRKQRTHIKHIYMIHVEDPGDYYLKPEGVLFVDNQGYHTLFSADSRFNFLRSTVQKFPFAELVNGVTFREHNVRLDDVTASFADRFDLLVDEMLEILRTIYDSNPRQHFYLEKFMQPDTTRNHFIP